MNKSLRAFTIVEVTVAIAVTMILLSLLLQVLTQSSTIWSRSNESTDTFREARASLQLMARELGQLRPMPQVDKNLPLLALEHHPETKAEDKVNQEVYALLSTANSGKADWCAVGYFCRWNPELHSYSLCRQFTRSDQSFANMKKVFNATAPLTGETALRALYGRPLPNSAAGSVDEVATYMWDLKFVLPEKLVVTPPQRQEWPQGEFSKELPPWLEIRCKVLGALAARKLKGRSLSPETWFDTDSADYKTLIMPSQQQFVTRISFAQ